MLEAALVLKEAFSRLDEIDKNYKHSPSIEEWEVAQVIKDCLQIFYEATSHFSGVNFPTSNVFFPDICEIRLNFIKWEESEHECVRTMVVPMKHKFEKYWEECSLLLAIVVVLDPRFKMDLVEYYYYRIYGSESLRYETRVRTVFHDLFSEYESVSTSNDNDITDSFSSSSNTVQSHLKQNKLSDFNNWRTRYPLVVIDKSEIEVYLEESVFPREEQFDILNWWSCNSAKFLILAKMARDILTTLATTVASEPAFSIGERVVDETCASLRYDVVEALVTTNDWLDSRKRKSSDCSTTTAKLCDTLSSGSIQIYYSTFL